MKSNPFKNALASTVLALIVTTPALSFGVSQGGTDGGGGNAIVCFNDKSIPKKIYADNNPQKGVITEEMLSSIRSVETYDYAYAKLATLEKQPAIVPIQDGEGFDQYARRIAKRVYSDAPEVSWFVEQGLALLKYQKALIRKNGVMTVADMADVGVVDSDSCVVTTMAVQVLESANPLNLDGRLFQHPKHTRQSMAILILHEVLYAAARQYVNAQDSSGVRELIRMIATAGAGYSRAELTDLMTKKFKSSFAIREGKEATRMLPETQILAYAVRPLVSVTKNNQDAFEKALPPADRHWNTETNIAIYMCVADADMKAQMKAYQRNQKIMRDCDNAKERYEDEIKENLQTVKNLFRDFHAVFELDMKKYDTDALWANGVQAQMEKFNVRPEVQEHLQKVYVRKMSEGGLNELFYATWTQDFDFWMSIDQEMRNSDLELP